MGRPRKFDYDEARRLRATGLSYEKIGRQLGVSDTAVLRACDDAFRKRDDASSLAYLYSAVCPDCGGKRNRYHERCRPCAERARVKVKDGRAYCPACAEWKPLADFTPSAKQNPARGVHGECRACDSARRRRYRARHREADNAYSREHKRRSRTVA